MLELSFLYAKAPRFFRWVPSLRRSGTRRPSTVETKTILRTKWGREKKLNISVGFCFPETSPDTCCAKRQRQMPQNRLSMKVKFDRPPRGEVLKQLVNCRMPRFIKKKKIIILPLNRLVLPTCLISKEVFRCEAALSKNGPPSPKTILVALPRARHVSESIKCVAEVRKSLQNCVYSR